MKWIKEEMELVCFGSIIKIDTKFYLYINAAAFVSLNNDYNYEPMDLYIDKNTIVDVLDITTANDRIENTSLLNLIQEIIS